MTDDHYATLGIEPRCDAAAIRAAYLSLMRRYHPDKNDSPAAVERAHAVIAAFAVLGDVEKRLHYDWGRRRAAEAAERARLAWIRRLRPLLLLAAAAVAATVVLDMLPATGRGDGPARVVVPDAPPRAAVPVRDAAAQPAALLPGAGANGPDTAPPPPASREACRFSSPGAEAAICNDDQLTALDRNIVTFFNQSLMFGAPTKRGALLDARARFLAAREACGSNDCLRALHLAHLRDLVAIVEQRTLDGAR